MRHARKKELLHLIQSQRPKKIMVIGDIMLDKYTWGQVERISPEAPIPVLRVTKEEHRLGGAASVVANVNALDCDVRALGVIGQDEAGRKIKSIFSKAGISPSGLLEVDNRPTIQKERILTSQQQLVRVDYEQEAKEDLRQEMGLLKLALEQIPQMDAIILSDYAKGVLSEGLIQGVIQEAKKHAIPVVCDPGKGRNYKIYKGVTTIKPNRTEAESFTGLKLKNKEQILAAAKIIMDAAQAKFLSLSLDKDGILLYYSENNYQFIETDVIEVFDVTGAGDMVITMIAVMLAQGVAPDLALAMANLAAEIEISHMGVVALSWAEIQDFLTKDDLSTKIQTLAQIQQDLAKDPGIQLSFTNGYFDNLSAGHLRFLQEAGKTPGRLVVGINSDACIQRQKGALPLLNQFDRARLLASLENVWRVVVFEEEDASGLIQALKPQIVLKGEQFRGQHIPEQSAVEAVGAEIRYIEHFSWKGHA